jgi:hypothetical protein
MADIKPTPLQPKKAGSFAKFMRWVVFITVVILIFLFWWNYYYVFGEGVKSGELNFVVKKGNIFKTYEGKLIQTGFKSKSVGTIQSYEFEFSVADDSVANVLMNNSGKYFDLHYKEYKGSIPWRGYSPYIVDKIILMKDVER